ncbi:hypothetical protein CRG98_005194 [Punica granatum]|uniref:Uncharacterized protein n=1 Tax=Punica granatum TaxID=22663 RepID=A0A2I0L1G0_PUNGR|nr:hypothetical protein CRG98_005194 [Punica granatum]
MVCRAIASFALSLSTVSVLSSSDSNQIEHRSGLFLTGQYSKNSDVGRLMPIFLDLYLSEQTSTLYGIFQKVQVNFYWVGVGLEVAWSVRNGNGNDGFPMVVRALPPPPFDHCWARVAVASPPRRG